VLEGRVVPSTLTVSDPGDDAPNCLRAVIGRANAGDTVVFDSRVFAAPTTISLTHGALTINPGGSQTILTPPPLRILGPGADRLTISGGQTAPSPGSSVLSVDRIVEISGLTVAGGGDSGIVSEGNLTLDRCAIAHNQTSGNGGGIRNLEFLALSNSTVSDNGAANGGGISNTGTLQVVNCTIAHNSAADGGGVFDGGSDSSTIRFSTIAGNSASDLGGGLYVTGRTPNGGTRQGPSLDDSIVACNQGPLTGVFSWLGFGADIYGPVVSAGSNVIQHTLGWVGRSAAGDQTGVDPQLGSLQDNGGPTLTMVPASASPAVDAGNSANAPPTDQRGVFRPQGISLIVDVGAVVAATWTGTVATHFVVTAQPLSLHPGESVHLHVRALDASNLPVPAYRGRVRVSTTDPQVGATTMDFGMALHPGEQDGDVVLKTTGQQTITLTDPANPALQASVSAQVLPSTRATDLRISVPGSVAVAGTPFTVSVTAVDLFGNVVPSYNGTVRVSDDNQELSTSHTFTQVNNGTYAFGLTLRRPLWDTVYFSDWPNNLSEEVDIDVYRDITAANGRGVSATFTPVVTNPFVPWTRAQLTLTDIGTTWAPLDAVVLNGLPLGLVLVGASVVAPNGTATAVGLMSSVTGAPALDLRGILLMPGDSVHLVLSFARPFRSLIIGGPISVQVLGELW
jgi:hypothetical protein